MDVPEIPDFKRDQIHRADLQRLSVQLRNLQYYFNDNFQQRGQGPLPPYAYDIFPGIVQADGGSPGLPNPTDGIRIYVSRGSSLENVSPDDVYCAADIRPSAFQQIFIASNLANLPINDLNNPPTFGPVQVGQTTGGGGPMPPPGTKVWCFGISNEGTGGGPNGSASQATPLSTQYVFWWTPPAGTFVVKLTKTSGTTGDQFTEPSYVYTANYLGGTAGTNDLGTGLTPQEGRTNGNFTQATRGLAYYDNTGSFQLLLAFEKPGTTTCP